MSESHDFFFYIGDTKMKKKLLESCSLEIESRPLRHLKQRIFYFCLDLVNTQIKMIRLVSHEKSGSPDLAL